MFMPSWPNLGPMLAQFSLSTCVQSTTRAACERSPQLLSAFPLALQVQLLVLKTPLMLVSHAPDIAAVSLTQSALVPPRC